jgi:hypothetical protein
VMDRGSRVAAMASGGPAEAVVAKSICQVNGKEKMSG